MCRMIAKVSVATTSIMDEMLTCPYSLKYLSEQGRLPENPQQRGSHHDGCGLAFIRDGNTEVHKRDRQHAWDDSYIQTIREARSNFFIAHNRLTSAGLESRLEGSHPFEIFLQGKKYAFSHNGTVYDYLSEAKRRNTSDTFLFLENILSATEPNDEESIIQRIIRVAKTTTYSSITAFLLTADILMVWRIFDDKDPLKSADRNLYYTMHMKLAKNSIVFSSEPLDNEGWVLMPNNTLISVMLSKKDIMFNYRMLF